MAGTLKGSLGLKSGPLAPTQAKLTTQYLVLDHMNNHYKKINQAKSAIDNRPPKSIGSSQKVRERKEREYLQKHGTSRPTSRMSARVTSRQEYVDEDYDEANWDEPEDDDERLVYDIMRTTLRENYGGSADATMGSGSRVRGQSPGGFNKTIRYQDRNEADAVQAYYKHERRPVSVRSNHSIMSAGSRTSLTGQNTKKGTYDGDLLQKRSHVFTEPEKPFTPRTLKSNRQSRLSEYKYYTPPPNKRQTEERDQTERKMVDTNTSEYRPKPKPRGTATLDRTGTQTLSESQLMFETLQSRDFRHQNKNGNDVVPKLDISMDQDHMKWIKEQSAKAEIRAKSGIKTPKDRIIEEPVVNGGPLNESGTLNGTGSARLTKSFGTKSLTRQKMSEAEEEQRYVAFAKDVTEEVLNRGIYTDRVLQKVFDRHVDKHKGTLKISRMRAILGKLREDFGITETHSDEDDEAAAESTLEVDPRVRAARIARHQNQAPLDTFTSADSQGLDTLTPAEDTLTPADDTLQFGENTLTPAESVLENGQRSRNQTPRQSTQNTPRQSAQNTPRRTPRKVSQNSADGTPIKSQHSTMNSTDTYKFGSTGEAFSTASFQRRGSQLSEVKSDIDERRSLASESNSTTGRRSRRRDQLDARSDASGYRSDGRQSDAGLGGTNELTATQALDAYQMTIKTKDMGSTSQTASEVDQSERNSTLGDTVNNMMSEPESSAMSSPSHASQPTVAPRRRRARKDDTIKRDLPDLHRQNAIKTLKGEVTPEDQGEVTLKADKEITHEDQSDPPQKSDKESGDKEESTAFGSERGDEEKAAGADDYEDDYEDDYDADDDDQAATTHRTSDDDF